MPSDAAGLGAATNRLNVVPILFYETLPGLESLNVISTDHLDRISAILAGAPAWARLALTSADARLRARGADELSALLLRRIAEADARPDENQLALPIS